VRIVVAALAVALVAGTASATPKTASPHPCRAALPRGPSLPAPLIVWDDCGVFRLERDGRSLRLRRHWLAYHGDGAGRRFGADLQLRRTQAGAYLLRRHGRTIWRSSGLYPNDYTGVAFGRRLFAFGSYTQRGIFLSDLRGPERLVARGRDIYPLGFMSGGLLLVDARHAILVIGPNGRELRRYRYARRRGFSFDEGRGVLSFVTPRGFLAELRDEGARVLGRAPTMGARPSPVAPGLLLWLARRSLVVTGRRGTVVALSRWPRALGTVDLGVDASPDRMFFAYRVTNARPGARHPSAALFVLRRGEYVARLVVAHLAAPPGCGGVPGGLGWNGHHLLYDFGDGRVVVFDLDSGARTNLTAFARSIPRRERGESVAFAWASSFAP
jgi:hypothetical protein